MATKRGEGQRNVTQKDGLRRPFAAYRPYVKEELVYGYVKHRDQLIKSIEAGMLAVIFVIHDRPWRTVNNISQLLLCHAAGFTGSLDGKPYIVEIKSSFISLYLHNIT